MQKWEYYIWQYDHTSQYDEDKLTELGLAGWELVSTQPHLYGSYLMFFKRPKVG